jgi:dynein light chain Tctex-type 1
MSQSAEAEKYLTLEKSTIDGILRNKIEKVLGKEKAFKNEKVKTWTEAICRECVRDLVKLQKPYKYFIDCVINQRNGTAMVQHATWFADPSKSIVSVVHWVNDVLHCLVNVYAYKAT